MMRKLKRSMAVLAMIVLVSITFFGCAIMEKSAYEKAYKTNTIEAWKEFMIKYPDTKYVSDVYVNLEKLFAERDWNAFEDARTIENLEKFIGKHPGSKYAGEAKAMICELAWKQAEETGTIESYEEYVSNNQNCPNWSEIKNRVAFLKEEKAWDTALQSEGISGFKEYLSKYPQGKHAEEAKEKAWDITASIDTIPAYQAYLADYFFRKNAAIARDRIQELRQKEAEMIEKLEWEAAEKKNTYQGYAEYLSRQKNSKFTEIAKEKIPKVADFTDAQIDKLIQAKNQGEKWVLEAVTVERLLFTGANLLDVYANWTDHQKARKVYGLLKRYELEQLVPAMKNVILMDIERDYVLFLVAKLGISGTEGPLNALLLNYGDKEMAEDYLNSGSHELYEGGKDWANSHGYSIMSGPGSSRVSWGEF